MFSQDLCKHFFRPVKHVSAWMIKQTAVTITAAIRGVICTIKGDAYAPSEERFGPPLARLLAITLHLDAKAAIFLSITEVCQGLVSGNHFQNE